MNKELIGVCGLYCGACDNYLAFTKGNEYLQNNEKFKEKNIEDVLCRGCHSDKRTPHCENCEMRLCAEKKKITVCSECKDFICEKIMKFYIEGDKWELAAHRKTIMKNLHNIRENGAEQWLESQNKRWSCGCGKQFSFYETNCHNCGSRVDSLKK